MDIGESDEPIRDRTRFGLGIALGVTATLAATAGLILARRVLALILLGRSMTRDDIRVRMSAYDEEIWPSPPIKKKQSPDFTDAVPISDFTRSGALAFPEIVGPIYDEINGIYGTDYEPGFK